MMHHIHKMKLVCFGERLTITSRGYDEAERLGAKLADIVNPDGVMMYASQTFRTIQTACAINKMIGSASPVDIKEVLGGGTPFFGSLDERMRLIAEGRYMERLNDYYRTGEQFGYRPLAPAADEMEDALESLHTLTSDLVVAVTHDINVASFLAGRGVVTNFDEDSWPYYLDAAVVANDDDGNVEYGRFRWKEAC